MCVGDACTGAASRRSPWEVESLKRHLTALASSLPLEKQGAGPRHSTVKTVRGVTPALRGSRAPSTARTPFFPRQHRPQTGSGRRARHEAHAWPVSLLTLPGGHCWSGPVLPTSQGRGNPTSPGPSRTPAGWPRPVAPPDLLKHIFGGPRPPGSSDNE